MSLYEPFLRRRSDKSKPQINTVIGDPFDLFSKYSNRLTFHFFTNDKQNEVFLAWKVLVSNSNVIAENIKVDLLSCYQPNIILSDFLYLKKYGIKLQYIIFNDNVNWKTCNEDIYVIDIITDEENLDFHVIRYSKSEFQYKLREIQGADMIMNKPLVYSTTELEGYLSDLCQRSLNPVGRAIFPGDVDLILYNNKNSINIIEFKKHTKFGKGNIENQSFRKYWYLDSKKYLGLAKLTRTLNKYYFYNFIYSTKNNELYKIKLEKISVDLKLIDERIINYNSKSNLIESINEIF